MSDSRNIKKFGARKARTETLSPLNPEEDLYHVQSPSNSPYSFFGDEFSPFSLSPNSLSKMTTPDLSTSPNPPSFLDPTILEVPGATPILAQRPFPSQQPQFLSPPRENKAYAPRKPSHSIAGSRASTNSSLSLTAALGYSVKRFGARNDSSSNASENSWANRALLKPKKIENNHLLNKDSKIMSSSSNLENLKIWQKFCFALSLDNCHLYFYGKDFFPEKMEFPENFFDDLNKPLTSGSIDLSRASDMKIVDVNGKKILSDAFFRTNSTTIKSLGSNLSNVIQRQKSSNFIAGIQDFEFTVSINIEKNSYIHHTNNVKQALPQTVEKVFRFYTNSPDEGRDWAELINKCIQQQTSQKIDQNVSLSPRSFQPTSNFQTNPNSMSSAKVSDPTKQTTSQKKNEGEIRTELEEELSTLPTHFDLIGFLWMDIGPFRPRLDEVQKEERKNRKARVRVPIPLSDEYTLYEYFGKSGWRLKGYRDPVTYPKTKDAYFTAIEASAKAVWKDIHVVHSRHQSSKELKYLIRKGIPDSRRREVWVIVSGVEESINSNPGMYSEALERVFGPKIPKDHRFVPLFGSTPFEQKEKDHHLSKEGRLIAKRLLITLAMENLDIDFCPKLTDIILLALLFMAEEEVFHLAQGLIKRSKARQSLWADQYHTLTLSFREQTLFLLTFDELIKREVPPVHEHINSLKIKIDDFALRWFSRLFVGIIPFQGVLHLFDQYLNEGSKVLFRVGIGILKLNKRPLLMSQNKEDFLTVLDIGCSTADTQELMKLGIKVSVVNKEIQRYQEINIPKVDLVESPRFPIFYRPKIVESSAIIDELQFEVLWSMVPSACRIQDPIPCYHSADHGFSLSTLCSNCLYVKPLVVIIKTKDGAIFGCFLHNGIKRHIAVEGLRESFVFMIKPLEQKFCWRLKRSEPVLVLDGKSFLLGGPKGAAIYLDDELLQGRTEYCDAFDSPPLTGTSEEAFECVDIEAYGFK